MSQEAETIVTEEAESSPNDVAQTILQELGGRMFIAMTGARHLTSSEGGLAFKLPSNFATDGINHFIIRLNWRDTYDVTFGKTRGLKYTVACEHKDIYADGLAEMFTGITQRRIRSRACRSWVTGTEANYTATLECRAPSRYSWFKTSRITKCDLW
jgi:hypothetical protein